ncbi:MAG: hypothetical protein JO066_01000 [Verrucomicrobia bacterium]|nr:hypothetical protein [Verrucomicrobiota bacterium]
MNYSDLASRLSQIGERLAKQANRLEGEILGRSAGKLAWHLDRFEEQLESHLASRKSREVFLENLLRSPTSKKHLTIALLKKASREVCAKRLKSEDLAAAKREFIKLMHGAGKQDLAVEFLKEAFATAVRVESGGKDKALLQREFIRLGQLLDEEFAKEISSRSIAELRRVATVNGIRFTDKTDRHRLTTLVRRYAQRAAFNLPAARVPSSRS